MVIEGVSCSNIKYGDVGYSFIQGLLFKEEISFPKLKFNVGNYTCQIKQAPSKLKAYLIRGDFITKISRDFDGFHGG